MCSGNLVESLQLGNIFVYFVEGTWASRKFYKEQWLFPMIDRLALLEELSVHCLSLVTDDPSTLGGLVLLDMQAAHNRDEGCDFLQITCRINQRDFWHEELVGSQTQPLWTANKYASEQIYGVPPAAREPRLHPGVTLLRMAAQHGSAHQTWMQTIFTI